MAGSKPCKNLPKTGWRPSAHYIGTEPSPKGLGICARFEKVGQKRRGKDGRVWVVVATGHHKDILKWAPVPKSSKIQR
jgi:hypothetical protein